MDELFSDTEKEILKKWGESKSGDCLILNFIGGKKVYLIGEIGYSVDSQKEVAEFEDFFERLLTHNLVSSKYSKNGDMYYKLKKDGYEFAESLK